MEMIRRERDCFWDAVKGLLIFFVVLGHVIQNSLEGISACWDNSIFRSIYTFHMPLFMIISGYFSWSGVHRNAFWLGHRVMQLLLPNATCFFVLLVCFAVLSYAKGGGEHVVMDWKCPLWYLMVLFECSMFGWLMFRKTSLLWRVFWVITPIALAALSMAAGTLWLGDITSLLFPCARTFIYMWPFFLLGLFLSCRGIGSSSMPSAWIVFVPVAVLCFIYYRGDNGAAINAVFLKMQFFRLIAGVACGLSVLLLCNRLKPILVRQKWLLKLGKSTMGVYILQDLFFDVFTLIWGERMFAWMCVGGLLQNAVFVLGGVFVTGIIFTVYMLLQYNRWLAFFLFGEERISCFGCSSAQRPEKQACPGWHK